VFIAVAFTQLALIININIIFIIKTHDDDVAAPFFNLLFELVTILIVKYKKVVIMFEKEKL
jgi:hypothetical protein